MATIRERSGKLIADFRYMGIRCRETTNLEDNAYNRRILKKRLEQLEAEITLGTFEYEKYFPKSNRVEEFKEKRSQQIAVQTKVPLFKEFTELWFKQKQVEWRTSYQQKVSIVIKNYLIPAFGNQVLSKIKKSDLLNFRASLAKVTHGKDQTSLKASRINQIMTPLRMILNDAAERYEFESPYKNINNLKESKIEVTPFSLEEVHKILTTVREDFRPYYTIRFFTGMRTSEIDGLQWKNIDLQRREIHIREALVNGELGGTKTYGSDRTIQMSDRVYQAFLQQKMLNNGKSEFVFCNRDGGPLDYRLVNKRVWHPLLRFLGLTPRRAYQTRHTAATLWLAAGENPEWVARQLGHSTTEMLFRVYSRYIPNVTRRDGSAFEAMLERLTTEELAHE
ncbi:Arm DNA-binding domain-containing protein [Acinetobacter baumannii]|jgi:integrase|uniref:Site-specific integrase n=1 Tax=Acinetobacter indicus TaxID=756892 RepID=A0A7S7AED0_9GAMM|nr:MULTISPECIES: site-specific integrase [Acinetobacter]AVN26590.1 site-specific integrase [Acinetobacter baumannii]EHZ6738808.1 site-specific integrase [Acinetobacter baumannii]EHZ6766078.1 site-specific integrase [Acinetobacter baumannii]EHZ7608618.1 site-specific integrase [Acinetobacter baumannii]EHZ7902332.1 site-specific integrase [Acinetobacter baumannii]